jgi:hypothetical protein
VGEGIPERRERGCLLGVRLDPGSMPDLE